jgi:DNA-binding CsgD family transcriptional regulator
VHVNVATVHTHDDPVPPAIAVTVSDDGGNRVFERHIPEHPLIRYARRRRGHGAVKISDFLSASHFHRLGLYGEFFRRLRVDDQMVISLPSSQPIVIGVALNRSRRNFTERDRVLLNLAQPHLVQAYRNAAAWTHITNQLRFFETALLSSPVAAIVLADNRRVRAITPKATRLLAQFLPDDSQRVGQLPSLLRRWIASQEKLFDTGEVPARLEPLVIRKDGQSIVVRIFRDAGQQLLLIDEAKQSPMPHKGFRLTARETEVLTWMRQGKTNREIAGILGMRPRTVQKHLEHVFQKMGVETRTAAAAKLLE